MNISVITLACLCAGLLFDPAGFLRLTLLASFFHEAGHFVFYIICTSQLPRTKLTIAGISINSTFNLSTMQDFIVTCGGPLFNFILAFILYLLINIKASYLLYFFMTINICVGAYNLLPIGVLDGARLLSLLESKCKGKYIYTIKKCAIYIFSTMLVCLAFLLKSTLYVKIGLIISAAYLLYKS